MTTATGSKCHKTTVCMYLSGGGFPSEEIVIERTVRGVELGLQKDAAVGYGL